MTASLVDTLLIVLTVWLGLSFLFCGLVCWAMTRGERR